jgi:uncharacterized protein (UPF0276 family)
MTTGADALGVGLGLRREFRSKIAGARHRVDFLEIVTETCFDPLTAGEVLSLRDAFPMVCHGINMSLGAAEPLDEAYLAKVYRVLGDVKPAWFSEHIAITHVRGIDIGHLAPVSFSEETISTVVEKTRKVQAQAGIPLLLENVAYYFRLPDSELTEHEFIAEIVRGADCGLLLDLNNLLANARNHGYDPYAFLDRIPLDRVLQVHLAGGAWRKGVYIDTHADPVEDDEWQLFEYVCRRSPLKAVLLERDVDVPPLEELFAELDHARAIMRMAFG